MKLFGKIHYSIVLAFIVVLFSLNFASAQLQTDILIFRQSGEDFEVAVKGLIEELEEELSVREFLVAKTSDSEDVETAMAESQPQLVVLMDNLAMNLYEAYQQGLPDDAEFVPSICLMASFMEFSIQGIRNTNGISYEVPLVTSAVKFRSLFPKDIEKIGVVAREFMTEQVAREQRFCAKEEIELVSLSVENKFKSSELKKRLEELRKKAKVQVLWVPNDSALINTQLIKSVWIPFVKKFKKPVIVGAEVLVNPKLNFGTFAVLPDHLELGVQAAELIFEIMDNDWEVEEKGRVVPPRSIYTSLNGKHARRFKISDEKLEFVDNVIE